MKIWLVAGAFGLILLVFFAFLTFLITHEKRPKASLNSAKKPSKKHFESDLDKMIKIASDTKLSDNDLRDLAKSFVATHKLGSKTSKELSDEVKHKLDFVSAFAANPNASAMSISILNKELKKISNSYKKEIDAYEQMGLAKRKIKEG